MDNNNAIFEGRLIRAEANVTNVQEDIKEIKKTLRWLIGVVFSLNSTIIGLLAKGFNII